LAPAARAACLCQAFSRPWPVGLKAARAFVVRDRLTAGLWRRYLAAVAVIFVRFSVAYWPSVGHDTAPARKFQQTRACMRVHEHLCRLPRAAGGHAGWKTAAPGGRGGRPFSRRCERAVPLSHLGRIFQMRPPMRQ
jgi:hypothetical protein